MIKNEKYSLWNRQISNKDIIRFCQIFEDKKQPYTCEVLLQAGPKYTYFYNHETKEANPFKEDYFSSKSVDSIKIESKFCKLVYGEKCCEVMFEGDEDDVLYQYFFTKIDGWFSDLKKLKRLKMVTTADCIITIFYLMILVVGFTVGYGFLSNYINNNMLSTVLSSVFLGLCFFVSIMLYVSGFPPYEIKIGRCTYKKYQQAFYSVFSLCILPILLGLFV